MERERIRKEHIKLFVIILIGLVFYFIGFIRNIGIVSAAVNNDHRPIGSASIFVENQTLHLSGYAFDPDCIQETAEVHIYIFQDPSNKICIKTFAANLYNIDAAKKHVCGFFHGFDGDVTVDKTGTWNLEVYAIDLNSDGSTAGIYNPIIYSGTVTFTKEPSISISTNALTFASDGTLFPYSVSVDTSNTGNYHVFSDNSWLRISRNRNKGSSGTSLLSIGIGYFYIFVDANTDIISRTGILTITHTSDSSKSQTIIVTQTGRDLQLVAAPIDITATSDGVLSSSYISIDTSGTGNYSVSSNSSWLTVGINNNKDSSVMKIFSTEASYLYVFVNENTSTVDRIGTLTITHTSDNSKKQVVTISQKGGKPTSTLITVSQLTVEPVSIIAESDGTLSQTYINVNTNGTGNYHVNSNVTWLTVGTSNNRESSKKNLSSITSKTLYLFAEENINTVNRTGTLTITHASDNTKKQTITVTQSGKEEIILNINHSEISIQSDGTISPTHIIKVSTNNTGGFRILSDSSWLKISKENSKDSLSSSLSYINSGNFYIFSEENTEESIRSAILTIVHDKDSTKKATIQVVQSGKATMDITLPYLSVNQSELSVAANGNFTDNNYCISVNTNNTGGFQVSGTANWLKISKTNSTETEKTLQYTNSGDFYLFAEENTSKNIRNAIISVTHTEDKSLSKAIIITQEPMKVDNSSIQLSISRDIVNANVNGKTDINYIEVETNNTNGFFVETDSSWIHIAKTDQDNKESKLSFETSNKFYIFVDKTIENIEREGKIIVSGNNGNISKTIFIRQAELIPILNVNPNIISIEQNGSFSEGNKMFIDTENTGGFTVAIKDASWLRLASDEISEFSDGFMTKFYDSSASIYLIARENQTESIRTGQIIIEHENGGKSVIINVSQSSAKNQAFIVDTNTHDFDQPDKAISSAINITADPAVNWTVTSNNSTWLKVSKEDSFSADSYGSISGSGNAVFYIIVEENKTYEERGDWIVVTAPGYENHEIYVKQPETEINIPEVAINQIKFSTSKKTFNKKKTSKIQVQYPNLPNLDIEEVDVKNCVEYIKYKSNKPKIISVNKNGVIRGKKKGKGKVSVEIKLNDGIHNASRKATVKVIVGKVKINIKEFLDKRSDKNI